MPQIPSIGAMTLLAALLAAPVLAQQSSGTPPATADQPPPGTAAPSTAAPSTAAPTTAEQPTAPPATAQPPAASVSPGATGNPHLVVATVKLKNGMRASKLIGSAIYNDQNQKIGSIDDLILTRENKVAIAVISVGGFLGIGNKLVAVPYDQLQLDTTKDNAEKVTLPGATKETLNALPNFTYGNS